MNTKTIIVASLGVATLGAGIAQSCTTIATSAIGVAVIKQILLGGTNKGLGILKDKDAFLKSKLMEEAMPSGLKKLNSVLEKVSPDLVKKEKEFIAETASFTATIAEPILKNAINNLTSEDVKRVAEGESGMATQILREKTYNQLVSAFAPKVDAKLNEFGIVKLINKATSSNNLIGSLLGGNKETTATYSLSQYATEQMVTGLFYIIQDYEKENRQKYLGK